MKEEFFHPLEFMPVSGVTVGHSATHIDISHMMVIIRHNLQLYGFSSLIAKITFCWGIMNIGWHVYVSRLPKIAIKSAVFLCEYLPFSLLLPSVVGLVACLSCSV
jgi:hypothetical protein